MLQELSSDKNIAFEVKFKCEEGHSLELMTAPPEYYSGIVVCDLCRALRPEKFMHCKECKYDVCMKCIDKEREK